jgi:hypothetical protein
LEADKMAKHDAFELKWKESKEYCSSYETEFDFQEKHFYLRISMVLNYTAIIALRINEGDELQTPTLVVGDYDSDVDDCIVKLQSDVEEALIRCFRDGNVSLISLIKNMGYSIPESDFS